MPSEHDKAVDAADRLAEAVEMFGRRGAPAEGEAPLLAAARAASVRMVALLGMVAVLRARNERMAAAHADRVARLQQEIEDRDAELVAGGKRERQAVRAHADAVQGRLAAEDATERLRGELQRAEGTIARLGAGGGPTA